MASGAETTRECIAELGNRYAGWCECGALVEKSQLRAEQFPCCPRCSCPWVGDGILTLGDPRVYAILDAVQGARIRLDQKRRARAALEDHFERSGGRSLIG